MTAAFSSKHQAEFTIRTAVSQDFPAIFSLFHYIIKEGETFPYSADEMTQQRARHWLMEASGTQCFVADYNGHVVGCIALRENRGGPANHVANATYMVNPDYRGKGIGRALGEHSLAQAKEQGYQAMQFNFVVSANEVAVKLWKSLGFIIVGTLPKGFQHASKGLVDVYIMHCVL